MKEIVLTRGRVSLVDDEDFERVSKYRWYSVATGSKEYIQGRVDGKDVYLHRFILNPTKGQVVDHRNGNGLDNRKENIRVCTYSDNNRHRPNLGMNNKSGYKGVSWNRKTEKWLSSIKVNSKSIHLGYFNEKMEAAKAYNEAATKYHGEFASINSLI